MRAQLLLFLFIASVAFAREWPEQEESFEDEDPLKGVECPRLNVYLMALKELKKIDVFQKPVNVDDYCRGEWDFHGTCCNARSAASFVAAENKLTDRYATELVQEVDELAQGMIQAEPSLQSKLGRQLFQNFRDAKTAVLVIRERFSQGKEKCNHKLKQIRSNSLCSICSGRSTLFFNNEKLLIPENSCQEIVQECKHTWKDIMTLMKHKRFFESIVTDGAFYSPFSSFKDAIPRTMKASLSDFVRKHKVDIYLKDCTNDNERECSIQEIAGLCNNLVQLVELDATDVEQIRSQDFKDKVKDQNKFTKALKVKIAKSSQSKAQAKTKEKKQSSQNQDKSKSKKDREDKPQDKNSILSLRKPNSRLLELGTLLTSNGDNSTNILGDPFVQQPFSVTCALQHIVGQNSIAANVSMTFI